MKRVAFELPDDQAEDLARYAEAMGVSPSEALSRLLEYVELDQWAFYACGERQE